jgi:hypothetical protein
VAKDRAKPFSRKHRRYWIPVTGGMIVIGVVNVAIGLCSYQESGPPERIELVIPQRDAAVALDAAGTIGAAALPADVMRAFAIKYPRTIPTGATVVNGDYVISFPQNRRATYHTDGTFVSED